MINKRHKPLSIIAISLPLVLTIIVISQSVSVNSQYIWAQPMHIVSTRGHFDESGNLNDDSKPYDSFNIASLGCPNESVIYVHGVWTAKDGPSEARKPVFENAIEIFDRARLSLESLGYTFPVIGFSWDSDTEISSSGWNHAKLIAKENGPKLAQFIVDFKDKCPQTKIRVIAHSLGARVVLSSMDSLNNNQAWNNKNFHIASVHLMGADVNSDEVSKNAADVLSSDGITSAYGKDIEEEVTQFYNLIDPEDDALEPGFVSIGLFGSLFYTNWNPFEIQPVYYPFYEQDLALGQEGMSSGISDTNRPRNYVDIDMDEGEIPNISDADADGRCDLEYPLSLSFVCTINQPGDNHLGYVGFRDHTSNSLINDGAMNIVVNTFPSLH